MFEDIARDNRAGAFALTRLAAERLLAVVASSKAADPGTFWDELTDACREMVGAKREVASVVNLAGRVLAAAERVVLSGLSPEAAREAVYIECTRSMECAAEAISEIGRHGASLLADGAVVATTSGSQAVLAVLERAAGDGEPLSAIVSESRPALEGVALADSLRRSGVKVTLVTDAALPRLVSRAGIVLVGADAVSEGDFVNKVGTYPLALAAREAGVPLYVAAPLDRFIQEALRGPHDRGRDPAEILASPPPGVTVENPYFESVPLALSAGIVTEEGLKAPPDVAAVLSARAVPPALLQILFHRT